MKRPTVLPMVAAERVERGEAERRPVESPAGRRNDATNRDAMERTRGKVAPICATRDDGEGQLQSHCRSGPSIWSFVIRAR